MSIDVMKQALAALEECIGYKTSPFMTRECEAAITALRAAIEQAQDSETEAELYKRLYELRGKALERPCLNCGHQPAKIKAMAQPEQKPVFEIGVGWLDDATKYPRGTKLYTAPKEQETQAEKLLKRMPVRGTLLEQTLGKVWDEMPHPNYQKETEQELVAWFTVDEINEWAAKYLEKHPDQEPRQWQSLTAREIENLWRYTYPYHDHQDFARAIEAKLKEKNT